ncbi:YugN-like family protein [Halalkalibacterium ligniniphilum]|uniref:YugN-like family protein n=1 Tax=Halalkalibacterium ligniniphilum TaxID=1134413 RepID=UPI000477D9A8|nr:YugN-like family protein [Halalkalibacterium ligniniphilum]
MIELQSTVENKEFKLKDLEDKLKPLGYTIGGGWEYDHGYFDYKIDEDAGYTFLRLPFKATDGEIGERGVVVQLGKPFLINHKINQGLDNHVNPFNGLMDMNAASFVNQFSEPVDKDATIDQKYMPIAKSLIQELEMTLLY